MTRKEKKVRGKKMGEKIGVKDDTDGVFDVVISTDAFEFFF